MFMKIVIDDQQHLYSPGQILLGRIKYPTETPHSVEVKMKLVGEEFTNYSVFHRGWRTNFLETKEVLITSGELGVGNHEFLFKVTLPKRIPSTYSGKYGYVKFYLRACLVKDGNKGRYEDEVEFRVFSPIDLNELENLWLGPNTHSDDLMIDRWCCIREEISMEVKLQRKAFVVGDAVNVAVILLNSSHLAVSEVRVKLFVRTQAKVATPRQEFLSVDDILTSDQGFSSGSYREKFYAFQLHIPPNAEVPNFDKCSLFSQTAALEVTAHLSNPTKPNLKVEVPLVLGHIPVDGCEAFYKSTEPMSNRGKAFLPDPAIIRPLSYDSNTDVKPESPNVTALDQDTHRNASAAPNPTPSPKRACALEKSNEIPNGGLSKTPSLSSSSKQSLQEIPYTYMSSSDETLQQIPLTVRIYENDLYLEHSPRKIYDINVKKKLDTYPTDVASTDTKVDASSTYEQSEELKPLIQNDARISISLPQSSLSQIKPRRSIRPFKQSSLPSCPDYSPFETADFKENNPPFSAFDSEQSTVVQDDAVKETKATYPLDCSKDTSATPEVLIGAKIRAPETVCLSYPEIGFKSVVIPIKMPVEENKSSEDVNSSVEDGGVFNPTAPPAFDFSPTTRTDIDDGSAQVSPLRTTFV